MISTGFSFPEILYYLLSKEFNIFIQKSNFTGKKHRAMSWVFIFRANLTKSICAAWSWGDMKRCSSCAHGFLGSSSPFPSPSGRTPHKHLKKNCLALKQKRLPTLLMTSPGITQRPDPKPRTRLWLHPFCPGLKVLSPQPSQSFSSFSSGGYNNERRKQQAQGERQGDGFLARVLGCR